MAAELGRPFEQQLSSPVKREHPNQIPFSLNWWLNEQRKFFQTWAELTKPITTHPDWTTPNEVELEHPSVILRKFSDGDSSEKSPILILPPQAGHTSVITDYKPGQSLVEVAIRSGSPVYACDWPEPTNERSTETIDDFIKTTNACVDAVSKNGKGITLVGLCQGGWQAAIYTSLYPQKVERLILAGAPIDFHAGNGMITNYAKMLPMDYFKGLVAAGKGNMPGQSMLTGFKLLNPFERFIKDPTDVYLNIDNPTFMQRHQEFNNWYEYPQDIPGDFYLQVVEKLFKENRLIRGELEILGTQVDLSQITCPVTLLAGNKDNITPPDQLFNARHYVSSKDVKMGLVDAGHIGLFMSRNAITNYWPDILKSPADGLTKKTAA